MFLKFTCVFAFTVTVFELFLVGGVQVLREGWCCKYCVQSLKLLTALFRYKLRFSSIVDGECHIRYLRDMSCTHALSLDERCVCPCACISRDYVCISLLGNGE